jgi:peptide/nickel transport system permease protein
MSTAPLNEIGQEFVKNKIGFAGIGILVALFIISIIAVLTIPLETLKTWNNPESWLEFPKIALPAWINLFLSEKIPEHQILTNSKDSLQNVDELAIFSQEFSVAYKFDDFPNDFIYEFTAKYSGAPLLQISVLRPDGMTIELLSRSLPYSESTVHHERIFSTDNTIKKNIFLQAEKFGFPLNDVSAEQVVFSESSSQKVLNGRYVFLIRLVGVGFESEIIDSSLILGGKVFGFVGTDELRRDLSVGLLWGTPLALFIGIAVAIGSVVMGLLYGVYAGFVGKKTDETMMRFNDVIYALPALPFLIILAVTISNSIFVMIGFLMIFGWVGIAKVSRSMALQIKTRQYVEASKIMGQRSSKIILRHILPQLLPYAFASVAISVPAAITTEAGLSFLGLGDPSFPTWGQILHDASIHGAAARGLWWWVIPPGLMIAVTGLAFVFIGNALDTIVNPRLKR